MNHPIESCGPAGAFVDDVWNDLRKSHQSRKAQVKQRETVELRCKQQLDKISSRESLLKRSIRDDDRSLKFSKIRLNNSIQKYNKSYRGARLKYVLDDRERPAFKDDLYLDMYDKRGFSRGLKRGESKKGIKEQAGEKRKEEERKREEVAEAKRQNKIDEYVGRIVHRATSNLNIYEKYALATKPNLLKYFTQQMHQATTAIEQ